MALAHTSDAWSMMAEITTRFYGKTTDTSPPITSFFLIGPQPRRGFS